MLDPDHVYLLTDAKQKKRIREILTERGLASYMNDTKWRELCRGLDKVPFRPAYQVKYVHADALSLSNFSTRPHTSATGQAPPNQDLACTSSG